MISKYIGDRTFYRRVFQVAIPIIIQNGITNFVSLLDNIMVGQVGTLPMSGVSIVNGLMFVFNLCMPVVVLLLIGFIAVPQAPPGFWPPLSAERQKV